MKRDIKDTIKKLLALAGNNPSEGEAKSAMLKARQLMAKYKVEESDIEEKTIENVVKEQVGESCTAMTESWMLNLSAIIAQHYCCVATSRHTSGGKKYDIGFTGLEDDFDVCKQIFLYAVKCIRERCKEIKRENRGRSATDIRGLCNAYGRGFCLGLSDAFAEQDKQSEELALVLVVPAPVQEATSALKRNKARPQNGYDTDGSLQYRAEGYADGKRFDPTTKLENKGSA